VSNLDLLDEYLTLPNKLRIYIQKNSIEAENLETEAYFTEEDEAEKKRNNK
jgi:3-methyladenine DNA glycosylase Mpg